MATLKMLSQEELIQRLMVALEMLGTTKLPLETNSTLVFAICVTYVLAHDDPDRLAAMAADIAERQAQLFAKNEIH